MMNKLAGVILAAGKGKRMKSKTRNKVTMVVGDKPMVVHAVDLLEKLKISPVVVVVGFAKDSVKKIIKANVLYAEQKKRLGTAHALGIGLKVLPDTVSDVLVIQGDDSAFYKEEAVKKLIKLHQENNNSLTFLTVELENPEGLGRIIRDKKGQVFAIVEEKEATESERKIKEINPACYVFSLPFLRKYLPYVTKSPVSGEYYLVSLVELAIKNKEKLGVVKGGALRWRGVNTKEELEEAQRLYKEAKS